MAGPPGEPPGPVRGDGRDRLFVRRKLDGFALSLCQTIPAPKWRSTKELLVQGAQGSKQKWVKVGPAAEPVVHRVHEWCPRRSRLRN
jgi:hypothetical protein